MNRLWNDKELLVSHLWLFHLIQSVFEMRAQILTTSYWLHVELGKNIKYLSYNFFKLLLVFYVVKQPRR
jgi:hypothetical protein